MQAQTQPQRPSEFPDELEEFAYATSHDLRAPLRAIENVSRWIEEDLKSNPGPELAEHMSLLRERVARMNRLLDDLLAYSRAGTRPGAVEGVDLDALLREVLEGLPPRQGIRIAIEPPMPAFPAAKTSLGQVLKHLLSNAIRHHDKMTGQVRVSARDLGDSVEISIQDDGPGIEARFHERIFKICQSLKSKEGTEGNGVGLALVKKILQKHGGSIALKSSPGEGSTFTVTWQKGR